MAEHKRPGGLTALAVLNFVFGGLGAIGLLALFALTSTADTLVTAAEAQGATVTSSGPGLGAIYAVLAISTLSTILLIVSGIGYLGLKKMLGRTLGNVYGIVSILSSVLGLILLDQPMGVGTIIGLVYPVLTLALLNTTFKDDFVN